MNTISKYLLIDFLDSPFCFLEITRESKYSQYFLEVNGIGNIQMKEIKIHMLN
jgi:hypothetical protein